MEQRARELQDPCVSLKMKGNGKESRQEKRAEVVVTREAKVESDVED